MSLVAKGSSVISATFSEKAARVAELPLAKWNQRELPHMTRYLDQLEKSLLWPNGHHEDSERHVAELYNAAGATDPLQQVLSVYQKSWLVEDLLMKADKMSMAASVELRTPFLDYRLVEWANRQPNHVKLKRTGLRKYETKSILRRFCAQRLPGEILTRDKRGFPVPVNGWLQEGLEWLGQGCIDWSEQQNDSRVLRSNYQRFAPQGRAGIGRGSRESLVVNRVGVLATSVGRNA